MSANDSVGQSTPFEHYPDDGLKLLPRMTGDTARREYGLKLQRMTAQSFCAYCETSLVDDYLHWLLLTVDHVLPVGECDRLGIPEEYRNSYSNIVLCCSGCNGFGNRYRIPWNQVDHDWTVEKFCQLRDKVFTDRKASILLRRTDEIRFFNSKPWSG